MIHAASWCEITVHRRQRCTEMSPHVHRIRGFEIHEYAQRSPRTRSQRSPKALSNVQTAFAMSAAPSAARPVDPRCTNSAHIRVLLHVHGTAQMAHRARGSGGMSLFTLAVLLSSAAPPLALDGDCLVVTACSHPHPHCHRALPCMLSPLQRPCAQSQTWQAAARINLAGRGDTLQPQ